MISSGKTSSSGSRILSILQNPGAEFLNAIRELDALNAVDPVIKAKSDVKPRPKSKKAAETAGNGTGFGGNPSENNIKATQEGIDRATKEEEVHDAQFKICFEKLRKNIPGAVKTVPIVTKLKESKGFCASFLQLLRNDSLLDIGSRMELYRSMLGVLLVLAKHPTTAEFLSHPLYQDPEDSNNNSSTCKQLLSTLGAQAKVFLQLQGKPVTTTPKKRRFDDVEILEMDESVLMATVITDTVRAVDSFIDLTLDGADSLTSPLPQTRVVKEPFNGVVDLTSGEDDGFMWISTSNSAPSSSSKAAGSTSLNSNNGSCSSSSGSSGVNTKPPPTLEADTLESEEAEYAKRMIPHRFEVIELCNMIATGKATHLYSAQAGAASASLAATAGHAHAHAHAVTMAANPKQRMTRIAKEMATLSTNLPVEFGSSIFVRVDESRMDLIKALIIGPLGTPYANGCFEFDIYLPGNYPQVPPQVLLRTTGQGSVRFNPNLYNCGKVCLSLLGTWAGPGWDPKLSTLLQVLVSIQSLILVPDPFYNEPGYQVGRHGSESDAYSMNIIKQCLQHAMLDQLKAPPVVFQEVIRAHFRNKRLSLKQQLKEWSKKVPACKAIAVKMEAELDKL